AYFLSVNRNKRSAALDFRDPTSRAALHAAAARADIVVENFLPGQLRPFGLDAASLRSRNPELIVCSITGFGQDGPYASLPGYDAVLQGFVGLQSITGEPDRAPVKVGVAVVDVLTGVHAASAILAALVGRLRGAGGCHLDVPLFEVSVASLVNVSQSALVTGQPARRYGTGHPQIVPYQTFEAADGALVVAVGNDEQWRRLCEAIGADELAADTRLATNPGRVLHRAEVVEAIAARVAGVPRDAVLARLATASVPAGAVRNMDEVVRDPALAARDMVRPAVLTGASAPVPLLALPWQIDGVRPPLVLPPPGLGQHTAEFLDRFPV
ncbi:MAG: CoA transferase, partial [Candidatus Eisenbacteria bacterium]